jgi:hypothetical protein
LFKKTSSTHIHINYNCFVNKLNKKNEDYMQGRSNFQKEIGDLILPWNRGRVTSAAIGKDFHLVW